jgi:hypothetical protein
MILKDKQTAGNSEEAAEGAVAPVVPIGDGVGIHVCYQKTETVNTTQSIRKT